PMKKVVSALNPALAGVEASCFDGIYITGDITAADFDAIATQRALQSEEEDATDRSRLALPNPAEATE
ncbi:MAG: amidophosphoribosyltransferase, partial [Rhizobacter sp.]|nr:amidophosphoribosyltransferase [Rhizobacter sp.]